MDRKKLAILFTVLLIVIGAGIGIWLGVRGDGGPPTPTPTPISQASVYISPDSQQVKPGDEMTVYVEVNPGQNGVAVGRIHLEFDTSVLDVSSIEPGLLFGHTPLVPFKEVDEEAGALGYALARVGNTTVPTPPGILAIVTFQVLDSAEPGSSPLTLKYVSLGNEKIERISEIEVRDATIEVVPQ